MVSRRIVLAEFSDLAAALVAAVSGLAAALAGGAFAIVLAARGASVTRAAAVFAVLFAFTETSLTLSTMVSSGFTPLTVAVIFVAFVTLAGLAGLVTARRLVVGWCVVVLARAAPAFWALAVFLFRISTVVVFLSMFLRAAALLFEVPARAAFMALF
jgi:hypothetical protein